MKKIGIIILNYNNYSLTNITVSSLIKAKTKLPFKLVLIDNGSEEYDRNFVEKHFNEINFEKGFSGIFIKNKNNLGFSGGNNIGINYLLKDKTITHICLLNSDVIVTDFWIDRLVDTDAEIIGPVCNRTGNEQTIPVNYEVEKNINEFQKINKFSQIFYKNRKDWIVNTNELYFFAVVIKKRIFNTIGLLDETFFPGSFEDADFCMRLNKVKITLKIHRGVYIHHFGSGSFEKISTNDRVEISHINKKRFENKWKIKFKDDRPKLLLSFYQDINNILNQEQQKKFGKDLFLHYKTIKSLIENLISVEENYKNVCIENTKKNNSFFSVKKYIQKFKKFISFFLTKDYLDIIKKIIKSKSICIFAPPITEERLKDGYFKRVNEIDGILKNYFKIYINTERKGDELIIDNNDNKTIIFYDSESKRQRIYIKILVFLCKRVYIHSILQVNNFFTKTLGVVSILDMHGVVPEEFVLHDDFINAQIYGDREMKAFSKIKVCICVTKEMESYIKQKYNNIKNIKKIKFIVLPICNKLETNNTTFKKDKIVIYAGGIQKWQKIDLMKKAINESKNNYKYEICVPTPELFLEKWTPNNNVDITISSRNYDSLCSLYKKCQFGFALRDNVTVNNVACPTKIYEYLQYGIIPIVNTENIGDFKNLGMESIKIEDFIDGNIPSNLKIKHIKEQNYKVINKLNIIFETGVSNLLKYLK